MQVEQNKRLFIHFESLEVISKFDTLMMNCAIATEGREENEGGVSPVTVK